MTKDVVIQVEGVSKTFAIRQSSNSLRQFIGQFGQRGETQYKQALKDVSFEVKKGDRLGIVGGNGAGKSTLLKLMSKVLWPDAGRITVDGSLGAMLEVGTGFYPDLTGRENIYMSATLMGMSRADVKKSFDEIVAFADIGEYIDSPVRYYSSGMYVRLGFAINACLKQDIVLIDEVLAVGDQAFKERCLKFINEQSKDSFKTYIIVSHNLEQIRRTCNKVLLLKDGELLLNGSPEEVISKYIGSKTSSQLLNNKVCVEHSEINGDASQKVFVRSEEPLQISLDLKLQTLVKELNVRIQVKDHLSPLGVWANMLTDDLAFNKSNQVKVECTIPSISLNTGEYFLDLEILDGSKTLLEQKSWKEVNVNIGSYYHSGLKPSADKGPYLWPQKWILK